jgi:hypothetical protein
MNKPNTLVLLALALVGLMLPISAQATAPEYRYSWGMVTESNGTVTELGGSSRSIKLQGNWVAGESSIGWQAAPALGTVTGSAKDNPGTEAVAVGARITSDPIPAAGKYSANVIQKGASASPGQIKLQIVPKKNRTVVTMNCRFKGDMGTAIVWAPASVTDVDDGAVHWGVCWRDGDQLGIEVDGAQATTTLDIGSLANPLGIRLGNKGPKAGAGDQHFGSNYCSAYGTGLDSRAWVTALVSGDC